MPVSKLLEWRRPKRLTLEDYFEKLHKKGLNLDGTAVMDPTPIAPPIGYKKTPSMVEIVRDMVRGERLRQEALNSGSETFEEAEDFDVGDDPDLLRSPYENDFDPPLEQLLQAGREAIAAKEKQAALLGAGAAASALKPKTGVEGAPPPPEAP